MAALPLTFPTLVDAAKRTDPNGQIADIVEALAQRNEILEHAMALEGNLPTGHRVTIRSGLPSVGWRLFNQGTDAAKGETIQVDEACGELVGRSEVDESLANLNGNAAAFRNSEDTGFMQSMANEIASTLFYGSTKTDPEEFHGWAPRYDALTGEDNSENVIDDGSTSTGSDQASLWFITWGPETAYLIFPKGSKAGIERRDLGLDYVEDGDSKKFLAYRTHFKWQIGLCVKDWRYHARVCNIDTSATSKTATTLIASMVDAYNNIRDFNTGMTVAYCNRTVMNFLDHQVLNKANLYLQPGEWFGRPMTMFRGIPIFKLDALTSAEAIVA